MIETKNKDDQYSKQETVARREAALKRMLSSQLAMRLSAPRSAFLPPSDKNVSLFA
jgi:hypothetical protein